MQPLVALRALRELINNPERTDKVFEIIRAMSGDAIERSFERFRETPAGRAILDEQRQLVTTLMDREALRSLPAGSLGSNYLQFVESEQLSADGLIDASRDNEEISDPGLRLFSERMRDQHDLWHVLTGYGRDTFGEGCLLAFSYAQTGNRGVGLIALIGAWKLRGEYGNGVFSAMWQAYRAGRRAAWLPAQSWESLLAEPLANLRSQLRIKPPARYAAIVNEYEPARA